MICIHHLYGVNCLYFVNSVLVFSTDDTLKFSLRCITIQWICLLCGRCHLFCSNIFCKCSLYLKGFWSKNKLWNVNITYRKNIRDKCGCIHSLCSSFICLNWMDILCENRVICNSKPVQKCILHTMFAFKYLIWNEILFNNDEN